MNKEQFQVLLQREGFPDPVEVQQAPNGRLGQHEHPFEVKALVIEGSIDITIHGKSRTYQAGDVFELGWKEVHSESYGSEGVKYLASRKQ
ncbi:cupin [Polynucleobacter sp. AP-Kaivos-20-H2]|jgi:quercetin dioxygenase-like cupin family protein|uniref:cupin n=1 Tax=Polynucleobacter sp. AP-Kaivos-20-H2 TaxID=2689104 RepID=UPI001C0BB213|nr:cupin [Polynucleobacter sp. AP-Kaivos-20-H2]MBU3605108.1 cupin [Polynucleobacter sp. AP-Kaivos-20-H2]